MVGPTTGVIARAREAAELARNRDDYRDDSDAHFRMNSMG